MATDHVAFERLVDLETLRRLAVSCFECFAVPLRLYAASGTLLFEIGEQAAVCALIGEHADGRRACTRVIEEVRLAATKGGGGEEVNCFTGARYDVVTIAHEQQRLGRLVLGPYRLIDASTELPSSLETVDERLDYKRALHLLPQMVGLSEERAVQFHQHVRLIFESLASSGHATQLTSQMHVATMRESYRVLSDKNAALEVAHARLQELDGLKTSFLSTVSHEFRTPLTSVIGYADLLLEGVAEPLSDSQRESLLIIRRQGAQLLSMVRDLLDISRLEQGAMPASKEAFDLMTVVKDAIVTVTPKALERNVKLNVSVAELPEVFADRLSVRQLLINLLDNAIKFSPDGAEVRLSACRAVADPEGQIGHILYAPLNQKVEIRVEDHGPGIPERERKRVFDAFYQVDHSHTREHGGAGLGLAIVRRLVDAQGGSVKVESNAPHGAVLVVQLPVHIGAIGEAADNER